MTDPDDDLPAGSDLRRIRQMHRDKRAAETKQRMTESKMTDRDAKSYEAYEQHILLQTVRDLRSRERLINGIEGLMRRDINLYYERGFDKHLARLTGATTT